MSDTKKRGYYGIALWEPKTTENLGTVMRNCGCFDADFVCLVGARYYHHRADTMKVERHIPVFEFLGMDDFLAHKPFGCEIVVAEVNGSPLETFNHPERAIYLFGGEDRTVPDLEGVRRVTVPTGNCLNIAVTTGIVMYDRAAKRNPTPNA